MDINNLSERLAESFNLESDYAMSMSGEAQGSYRITDEQYNERMDALDLPIQLTEWVANSVYCLKASPDDFARMGADIELCKRIVGEWENERRL
jgi:hypothetical protein